MGLSFATATKSFPENPQPGTGKTANLLMLSREQPFPREYQAQAEYTQDLIDRLAEAHAMRRHQQIDIRQKDS